MRSDQTLGIAADTGRQLADALFEASPVGIALVREDAAGVLRFAAANGALCRMLSRDAQTLRGQPIAAVMEPQDRHFEGLRTECDVPVRCRRPDNRVVHAQVTVREHPGVPGRAFIAYVVDVGGDVHVEAHLDHVRTHDGLTGLLHRQAFELELALADDARGVVVFGLDGLGQVNSRQGGAAGDRALQTFAEVLRTEFRPPDVLARLGGDEFAVLVNRPLAPLEAANSALARLRATAAAGSDADVALTASAGVCCITAETGPVVAAREAALGLLAAKEDGRDRARSVDRESTVTSVIRERLLWAERVREALAYGRFRLFEQPMVRVADGRVTRSELLLRMDDGTGTLISPGRFMAAAERSGQVRAIDLWVVRRAVLLLSARQAGDDHAYPVQVNLSASSLSDTETVDALVDVIRRARIDATALTFEVTETTAISNMDVARRVIDQLAELGCSFAIDDFGTGYGSFSYLKRLPVTQLKIDGEFIRELPASRQDRATVRAMVDVAEEYGLQTVAEFVENEELLRVVTDIGVDYAQGYHVGVPRPVRLRPGF